MTLFQPLSDLISFSDPMTLVNKPHRDSVLAILGRVIADAAAQTGQTSALVNVNIHRGLAKLAAQVDEFAHAH